MTVNVPDPVDGKVAACTETDPLPINAPVNTALFLSPDDARLLLLTLPVLFCSDHESAAIFPTKFPNESLVTAYIVMEFPDTTV